MSHHVDAVLIPSASRTLLPKPEFRQADAPRNHYFGEGASSFYY